MRFSVSIASARTLLLQGRIQTYIKYIEFPHVVWITGIYSHYWPLANGNHRSLLDFTESTEHINLFITKQSNTNKFVYLYGIHRIWYDPPMIIPIMTSATSWDISHDRRGNDGLCWVVMGALSPRGLHVYETITIGILVFPPWNRVTPASYDCLVDNFQFMYNWNTLQPTWLNKTSLISTRRCKLDQCYIDNVIHQFSVDMLFAEVSILCIVVSVIGHIASVRNFAQRSPPSTIAHERKQENSLNNQTFMIHLRVS